MTRKRFVKLLMSMGLQRNTANAYARRIIAENRKRAAARTQAAKA